ncbi:hypothetical protein AeMF1_002535 [Aphanomyces euteiches]|nr:hypothetical protein AeMF1_002535 [Aphanomyces euteiches]KAH9184048.1 hypothetical protein AeNC1_013975 [Aphanomyces euteiches]
MGSSFDGEVLPMSFVCAHFKPKTPLSIPNDELCQWLGFDGASMVTPMPDATYFAAVDLTPDQDGQFQVAATPFQAYQVDGTRVHSVAIPFSSQPPTAATYADKNLRVFLAGDSARCHTPLLGQGMNAGIQDAVMGLPPSKVVARQQAPRLTRHNASTLFDSTPGLKLTIEHESQDAVTGFAVISSSEVENHALYGVHNRCVFIIRPDGYVGFRNENATTNDVLHYLSSQGSIQNVANDKPSVPAHDTSSWMGISLGLAMTLTFGLAALKLSDRIRLRLIISTAPFSMSSRNVFFVSLNSFALVACGHELGVARR